MAKTWATKCCSGTYKNNYQLCCGIKVNKTYTFKWGKTETRNAEILNQRTESFIRFHWIDDDPKTYFELKIHYNELTKDHLLEVTDFAIPGEEEDTRNLWNSQIEILRRICGV
jgi:hypothetical protein